MADTEAMCASRTVDVESIPWTVGFIHSLVHSFIHNVVQVMCGLKYQFLEFKISKFKIIT